MKVGQKVEILIHVTDVHGCPLKKMMELMKFRKTNPKDVSARIGSLVHKYIELRVGGETRRKSANRAFAIYNGELTSQDKVKAQKLLKSAEKWLYENIFKWDRRDVEVEATREMAVNVGRELIFGGRRVQFIITGTPDMVLYDDNQIIDFKTGKFRRKSHALQVGAYSHLVWPDRQKVSPKPTARIVHLGDNTERFIRSDDLLRYMREWKTELNDYILNLADMLETVNTTGEIPEIRRTGYCHFCEYRMWCWGDVTEK